MRHKFAVFLTFFIPTIVSLDPQAYGKSCPPGFNLEGDYCVQRPERDSGSGAVSAADRPSGAVPFFRSNNETKSGAGTPARNNQGMPQGAQQAPPDDDQTKTGTYFGGRSREINRGESEGNAQVDKDRFMGGRVRVIQSDKSDFRKKAKKFRKALARDAEIRSAYSNWSKLDSAERKRILQKVVGVFAQIYGLPEPALDFKFLGNNLLGGFESPSNRVWFNDKHPAFDNPDEAFNTIAHECTHYYQHALVDKLNAGGISKTDPVFSLAVALRDSFSGYCCFEKICREKCLYMRYRNQLVESQAFDMGEFATLYLRSTTARLFPNGIAGQNKG